MKYLDPKNELAIQKVFGQNMQLCKSLINCLLPQSGSFHAQEVKILSNADTIVCPVFRNPSLAVECRGESGEPFMVLFQMMWTDGFLQSILFDADKAYIRYQNQVQFSEFSMPVVGIALVNDLFEYERDHYYHYFAAVEEAHSGNLVKDFSLIFVELPKVSLKQNEVNKKQHSWLNYFIHVGESMLDVPELLRGDDEIMAAVNLCNIDSCSEKEIFEYNKYKSVTDVKKGINNEAEARGFRRGIEKGLELGLEKGFARGYQKGGMAAIRRLALKGLQTGISPDEVMMLTDLNQMTIDNLVNLVGEFGASADKHLGD